MRYKSHATVTYCTPYVVQAVYEEISLQVLRNHESIEPKLFFMFHSLHVIKHVKVPQVLPHSLKLSTWHMQWLHICTRTSLVIGCC